MSMRETPKMIVKEGALVIFLDGMAVGGAGLMSENRSLVQDRQELELPQTSKWECQVEHR